MSATVDVAGGCSTGSGNVERNKVDEMKEKFYN